MTWILPLQPNPSPVPSPPSPAGPDTVTVQLPRMLYEKLDGLRPAEPEGWLHQFWNSPPAVVGLFSLIVAVVAVVLSWRAVKSQIEAAQTRELQGARDARRRELEAAKREAVLTAVDALHGLYDVLIDIDDDRKSGGAVGSADLAAYRAAHAATRRAMLKLRVFGCDEATVIRPYDKVRDSAYDFVHGTEADRSHPELREFRDKQKAMDASLKELIGLAP